MASPTSPKADLQKNVESDSTPSQPFPPPKTDKPRPHVCTTCTRSFARLEHLKRHERSHTKEKPFECDQCGRCFARRDLLLRHQQKLHQTGNPSKPRTARRESTSGVPPSRARKSSIAGAAPFAANQMPRAAMRPRANTISHIDGNALNMLVSQHTNRQQALPPFMHQPVSPMPNFSAFDFNPMPGFGHLHAAQNLSKIETSGLGLDIGGGLKTAPLARFTEENRLFSTVNPAQLHFGGQTGTPESPFTQSFPSFVPNGHHAENHMDWLNTGNDAMMSGVQDSVVDGSSPSAISTGSQSGFSEVMIDGSNQAIHTTDPWDSSMLLTSTHFSTDNIPVFSDLMQNTSIVPGDLHDPNSQQFLPFVTGTTGPMNTLASATAFPGQFIPSNLEFSSDDVSFRSSFIGGNGQSSPVRNSSTFGITDSVRQALLFSLTRPIPFNHMSRYSQSGTHASLANTSQSESISVSLPSTVDLQRYVNSYIQYFHPHLPFLHIPTLTFDSPVFTNHSRSHNLGDAMSGGCLILAMAAIGASFEFEHVISHELFEFAKKLISIYLEERRISVPNGQKTQGQETPLWLVQAMLINLIYGHQFGDQKATEIASTNAAALISLAKSASLDKSDLDMVSEQKAFEIWYNHTRSSDGDGTPTNVWDESMSLERANFSHWYQWKMREERRRTLFSVFILSSFSLIAYNFEPMILNSEINLELPCEENLWAAKSPLAWNKFGGITAIQQSSISFGGALTFLLSANKRQASQNPMSPGHIPGTSPEQFPQSQLTPSTFGCFILINALHISLFEIQQRYQDREWNIQEMQQLYAQMAPALQEWQSAWASNPNHHLERQHSFGPLAADCVPLLDLAYIRLCVNFGPSKEAFLSRDFRAVANLSYKLESQHSNFDQPKLSEAIDHMHLSDKSDDPSFAQSSRPDRSLRKAAFYAADSLKMAHKLGLTFADFTSRDLPIQNTICSFDCAIVLAEWLATMQDRIGPYFGIIGRENADLHTSNAANVLLDEDDRRLIAQIAEIISHTETKINTVVLNHEMNLQGMGYASRLLVLMALMLDRAAVWGITGVMATCLRTLATVMDERAQRSLLSS